MKTKVDLEEIGINLMFPFELTEASESLEALVPLYVVISNVTSINEDKLL